MRISLVHHLLGWRQQAGIEVEYKIFCVWYCRTEGENQTLVGAIPFCGEHPGPRFEDKFRSANQIDGISIADGGKMADS